MENLMTTLAALTIAGGILMIPLEILNRRREKRALAELSRMLERRIAWAERMNRRVG